MIIREGSHQDIASMYDLLHQVWTIEAMPYDIKLHHFNRCLSNNSTFYIAEENNKTIGMLMLHIQYKLIKNGGSAAFIEEVVVDKNNRGKGVGKKLVEYACNIAKSLDCYKVSLSCFKNRVAFYERCGFDNESHSMRLNIE